MVWNKANSARDIERWHKAGWITDDGLQAITGELAASTRGFNSSTILALSGVVLLGFGAMSFVAANWAEIPRLVRLLVLFGLSAGAYFGAAALFSKNHPGFGHGAVLLGVALFGANIMQIAQMYHVAGRPTDMVLIWSAIAFVSGVVFKSSPVTALSMLLMCLWSGWEGTESGSVHWPFLPAWLVISAAMFWQRSSMGLYLASAAMTFWLVSLSYPWWGAAMSHWVPLLIGGVVLAASVGAETMSSGAVSRIGRVALGFSLVVVFAALSGMQYLPGDVLYGGAGSLPLSQYIAIAAVKLIILLAVMWWCVERGNNGVLWLAYLLFSLAVLAIYFKTVGSLLGSAVFFVVAGLIVIALAWCAQLLRDRSTYGSGAET